MRRTTAVLVWAVLLVACGGAEADTTVVVDVSGDRAAVSGQTTHPMEATSTVAVGDVAACPIEEVCTIEVPFAEIPLDAVPASISLDGDRAWVAAPDASSVLEVDLAGASVERTLTVDEGVIEVVPGGGSLWAITYEFSFGSMLRIDPTTGSTLATIGEGNQEARSLVVLDDSVWAVAGGYGEAIRVDLASNEVTDVVGDFSVVGGRGETSIVADDGTVWAIVEGTGSVERIDATSRAIESTLGDLGYVDEVSGEFTTILADGPKALAATDAGIWVLSDVPNPTGDANVVGGGALFLLDSETGAVIRQIDLIREPAFGRPGLAFTDGAAWYLDFIDHFLIRVDLDTERQTLIRLDGVYGVGVVSDGSSVWVAAEGFSEFDTVIGIDTVAAAAASVAFDG